MGCMVARGRFYFLEIVQGWNTDFSLAKSWFQPVEEQNLGRDDSALCGPLRAALPAGETALRPVPTRRSVGWPGCAARGRNGFAGPFPCVDRWAGLAARPAGETALQPVPTRRSVGRPTLRRAA